MIDECKYPYEVVRSKPTPGASWISMGRHVLHHGRGQTEYAWAGNVQARKGSRRRGLI